MLAVPSIAGLGSNRNRVVTLGLWAVGALTVILILGSLIHSTDAGREYIPTFYKAEPPTPSSSNRGNGTLLMVLPKDRNGEVDFGFKEKWLEMCIDNRKAYAKYHGYDFLWEDLGSKEFLEEAGNNMKWGKIAALQHAMDTHPEAEWIWMLDSDVILMNPEIDIYAELLTPEGIMRQVKPAAEVWFGGYKKLPEHEWRVKTPKKVVPEEVYLIAAEDHNGVNMGSFFVRRNEFMSAFVDLWHDPYFVNAGFHWNEQDALSHLILNHKNLLKHIGIIKDRKLINSYAQDYKDGELLVHFAGCRAWKGNGCDPLFREFWDKRKTVTGVKAVEESTPRQEVGVVPEQKSAELSAPAPAEDVKVAVAASP